MNPSQSAVIVAVPQAEGAVGGWRRDLNVWRAAAWSAHGTVLTPFVPPGESMKPC